MSRSKVFALLALTVALLLADGCKLSGDACLRMSDCDDGRSCVEGTCVGSAAAATTSAGDADTASSSSASDASAE